MAEHIDAGSGVTGRRAARPPRNGRLKRAIASAGLAALAIGVLAGAPLTATADPGGSGGTVGGGGGGGGTGYEYRFWSSDNGTTANTNAINDMMAWPGWGAGNAANRLAMINATCDLAFDNAIGQHGGTRDDYRIVLVGGFIGDGAGGGKVWYNGSPPDGSLNQAYNAAWPGLAGNLNAITTTGTPERPNPATQQEIDDYRQYVNQLSLNALGGDDSNVVRICDVLKFDRPGNPAPQDYPLSISTAIQGAPTGPGQNGAITDLVNSSNGGSTISESVNARQILYVDTNHDGTADAFAQRDFPIHNNTGSQNPGVTFSPSDLGQTYWLGSYWIDTWVPQQGGMRSEVWHYGQNDPLESFSVRTNPQIGVIKFDTGSGFPAGDRNDPADRLVIAPDAETPISFSFSNQGDEPLTNITFADATTAGSGTVEDLAFVNAQGEVTIDASTGYLVVNGAPLTLAPGEVVDATGVLRGVVVDAAHTNVVTVNATGAWSGTPVSDDDPWNGKVEEPEIDLIKWDTESGREEGDRNTVEEALVIARDGETEFGVDTPIGFEFTNTGDSPLTELVFTDSTTAGSGTVEDLEFTSAQGEVTVDEATGFLFVAGKALVVAPGESVQVAGVLRGATAGAPHTNNSTIDGVSALSGAPVSDEDPWNGEVEVPEIDLIKWDTDSEKELGDRNTADEALIIARDGDSEQGVDTDISFEFTNTGNSPLTDLVFTDSTTAGSGTVEDIVFTSEQGEVTIDEETGFLFVNGEKLVIVPGESVLAEGVLRGATAGAPHTNNSTIDGVSTLSGYPVSDEDPWNGEVEVPEIALIKWDDASGIEVGDRNESEVALIIAQDGESGVGVETKINFDFTNTGNSALKDITFVDETTAGSGKVEDIVFTSAQGAITVDSETGFLMVTVEGEDEATKLVLAPGETVQATGMLRGVAVGELHTDNAGVTGKSVLSGWPVEDEDPWNGLVEDPSISLIKFDSASGIETGDRNEAGQALTVNGDTEISFLITNTGNVDLVNVIFADSTTAGTGTIDKATVKFASAQGEIVFDAATGLLSLKAADGTIAPLVLAPDETLTGTGTLKGVEPGTSHTDNATVEGETPTGKKVNDSDPWNGKADQVNAGQANNGNGGLSNTGVNLPIILIGTVVLLGAAAGVALIARKRQRTDA